MDSAVGAGAGAGIGAGVGVGLGAGVGLGGIGAGLGVGKACVLADEDVVVGAADEKLHPQTAHIPSVELLLDEQRGQIQTISILLRYALMAEGASVLNFKL